MFNHAYAESLADSPATSRSHERDAIQRSIDLMEKADAVGVRSPEAIVALNFLRSLWTIFVEDLAGPQSELEPALRASLISIGLSLLRQAEDIRMERERSFAGAIEISRLIMEGLK